MTNHKNAQLLRDKYLKNTHRKGVVNICTARAKWNGCDYCDVFSGCGLECWKQDGRHNCVYVREEKRGGGDA